MARPSVIPRRIHSRLLSNLERAVKGEGAAGRGRTGGLGDGQGRGLKGGEWRPRIHGRILMPETMGATLRGRRGRTLPGTVNGRMMGLGGPGKSEVGAGDAGG